MNGNLNKIIGAIVIAIILIGAGSFLGGRYTAPQHQSIEAVKSVCDSRNARNEIEFNRIQTELRDINRKLDALVEKLIK